MAKPKLQINKVFILEEVLPYEGTTIIGVFISAEAAMDAHPKDDSGRKWRYVQFPKSPADDHWATRSGNTSDMSPFLLIEEHQVRVR